MVGARVGAGRAWARGGAVLACGLGLLGPWSGAAAAQTPPPVTPLGAAPVTGQPYDRFVDRRPIGVSGLAFTFSGPAGGAGGRTNALAQRDVQLTTDAFGVTPRASEASQLAVLESLREGPVATVAADLRTVVGPQGERPSGYEGVALAGFDDERCPAAAGAQPTLCLVYVDPQRTSTPQPPGPPQVTPQPSKTFGTDTGIDPATNSPLALVQTDVDDDGLQDVVLAWRTPAGTIRAAAYELVGNGFVSLGEVEAVDATSDVTAVDLVAGAFVPTAEQGDQVAVLATRGDGPDRRRVAAVIGWDTTAGTLVARRKAQPLEDAVSGAVDPASTVTAAAVSRGGPRPRVASAVREIDDLVLAVAGNAKIASELGSVFRARWTADPQEQPAVKTVANLLDNGESPAWFAHRAIALGDVDLDLDGTGDVAFVSGALMRAPDPADNRCVIRVKVLAGARGTDGAWEARDLGAAPAVAVRDTSAENEGTCQRLTDATAFDPRSLELQSFVPDQARRGSGDAGELPAAPLVAVGIRGLAKNGEQELPTDFLLPVRVRVGGSGGLTAAVVEAGGGPVAPALLFTYGPDGATPGEFVAPRWDGRYEIGTPRRRSVERQEPLVVLNAPPTHFDVLDGRKVDVNRCYGPELLAGNCTHRSRYQRTTSQSATKEVTQELTEDWALQEPRDVESFFDGLGKALEGIGKAVGEDFTKTRAATTTTTISVEAIAQNTDKAYVVSKQYDVLEYPLFVPGEAEPQGTLAAVTPTATSRKWLDTQSPASAGFRSPHETGSILSYPRTTETAENPFVFDDPADPAPGTFGDDEYELSATSSFSYRLDQERLVEDSARRESKSILPFDTTPIASFFDNVGLPEVGDAFDEEVSVATTRVGDSTTLEAVLGAVDARLGSVSYFVKPFAYYTREGALVLDYAVEPGQETDGTQSFWQRTYGRRPNLTFNLPRLLDREKGEALTTDAKREQTSDVSFGRCGPGNAVVRQPYGTALAVGSSYCLSAEVRNHSLKGGARPAVRFFVGDPRRGGTPLGTATFEPTGLPDIPQRTSQRFLLGPLTVPADWSSRTMRIFAAIDGTGVVEEIHEDDNVGWAPMVIGATNAGLRKPLDVDATRVDDTTAAITWSFAPQDADTATPPTFVVRAWPGGQTATAGADDRRATIAGLERGEVHRFTVEAVSGQRTSPVSDPSEPLQLAPGLPGAPTITSVTQPGPTSLLVDWVAPNSVGDSPLTRYELQQLVDGDVVSVRNIPADSTELQVTGLGCGVPYVFRVRAVNDDGAGPLSDASDPVQLTGPPPPPRAVKAIADRIGGVTVSWLPPAAVCGSPVTRYRVVANGGERTIEVPAPAAADAPVSVTLTDLQLGQPYVFSVKANVTPVGQSAATADDSGPSDPTAPVVPVRPPGAPTLEVAPGPGRVQATWTPPTSDGGTPVRSYRLVAQTVDEPRETRELLVEGGARVATITGLTDGRAHRLTLRAVNDAGDGAAETSAEFTPADVPGAPRDVVLTPGDGRATVSWRAPASDGGTVVTAYRVSRIPATGPDVVVAGDQRGVTLEPLPNGEEVRVTVAAVNQVGAGPESGPAGPVTPAANPEAPTDVSAQAGDGRAVVTWRAPQRSGGLPLTGYDVVAEPGGRRLSVGPQNTQVAVEDLPNGRAVRFFVQARTDRGPGALSAPSADVVPQPAPVVRFVARPDEDGFSGRDVRFAFDSSVPGAATRCVLDGVSSPCVSPLDLSDLAEGAHTLTVIGETVGGTGTTGTARWRVDRTAPTVELDGTLPDVTSNKRVTIPYRGQDRDAGVGRYDVRFRWAGSAGGASGLQLPAGWQNVTAVTRSIDLSPGTTACFSVRARDVVGNESPWSRERCTSRALDDRSLARRGSWGLQKGRFFLGTLSQARRTGSTLTTTIGAAGKITLLARRCSSCGKVAVRLRGRLLRTVSLERRSRDPIVLTLPAGSGGGSLVLRGVGRRPVGIDGVAVHRRLPAERSLSAQSTPPRRYGAPIPR